MIFYIIFVSCELILSIQTATSYENYCKLKCNNKIPNVACDCTKASSCDASFNEMLLDEEEVERMVKLHNQLRRKLANANESDTYNGVANMMALQYDLDLEYVAMCALKKCVKDKAACSRTKAFKDVGQNIYHSKKECTGGRDIMEAFNDWFMQVRFGSMDCFTKAFSCKRIDEFTQMVHANVVRFGCARAQVGPNACTIICNYGPKIVAGAPVLRFGPPGSACPPNAPNVNGLCTPPEISKRSLGLRHQLTCNVFVITCAIWMLLN